MARLPLIAALVLTGCAHAPPPDMPISQAPAERPEASSKAPTGLQVEEMLSGSGLNYTVLEPEKRWMIAFAGKRLPRVVVFVVHGGTFTIVMGKLFTVTPATGVDFYRVLARKNFDHDQIKLSVDDAGGVYASYEVPTRLLDREELLDDVYGLASAIDKLVPDLVEHAAPGDLEETPALREDDEEEETPERRHPPLPRPPPVRIIEVRTHRQGLNAVARASAQSCPRRASSPAVSRAGGGNRSSGARDQWSGPPRPWPSRRRHRAGHQREPTREVGARTPWTPWTPWTSVPVWSTGAEARTTGLGRLAIGTGCCLRRADGTGRA